MFRDIPQPLLRRGEELRVERIELRVKSEGKEIIHSNLSADRLQHCVGVYAYRCCACILRSERTAHT